MPTINQLVRKNRKDKVRKSKAPVLGVGLNTIKKKATDKTLLKNVEFVLVLVLKHLRNQTQHYVSTLVFVYQTVKKLILISQESDTTYKNIVLY